MAERTKFTMRDVARLARVSTSTVSAVINETVTVSPVRTKRVRDAMAALDYHPDEVARSLKTGKTNVIGVVIPDITNAFYPEVIRGVEEAARQAGYGVLLCDSGEDAQNEGWASGDAFCAKGRRSYPRMLCESKGFRCYGPATFSNGVCRSNPARHRRKHGLVGQRGRRLYSGGAPHSAWHKRIAMLVGSLELSPHRDRLEGFRKAMQESNLPIRNEYLIGGGVQIEDGRRAGLQLLDLSPGPTAVVVSNNKLLLGLFEAIDKRKVKIPAQLSVIGFDDYLWNRYVTPSLTVIAQATSEMGLRAFELLHQIINSTSHEVHAQQIRLKTELRIRNSTASPTAEPRKR